MDKFSERPLVELLPRVGNIKHLERDLVHFRARYQELSDSSQENQAELEMLRAVLSVFTKSGIEIGD